MSSNETGPYNGTGGGMPCGQPPPWDLGIYGDVSDKLWLIFPPIIIIIGLIGNLLTVVVLFRQIGRWSSTAVFLFALALSDTVQLLSSPLRNWLFRGLEKDDVRHLSELGCKFSLFFTYGSVQYSSWILVAVTLERLFSVLWPHKVRQGCTPRTSAITCIIIFVMVAALNCHFFYGHGVSDLPQYFGQGLCEVLYEHHLEFVLDIWPWIDFAVAFAVPFTILLVCNIIIITKLQKTHVKRKRMSIVRTGSEKSYSRDKRNITITLILLNIVFFICLTPIQIFFIILPYRQEAIEALICVDFDEFLRQYSGFILTHSVVNNVSYINAAFNFILYVFSGNRFRKELIALFTCRKSGTDGVFGNSTASSRRSTVVVSLDSQRRNSRRNSSKSVTYETSNDTNGKLNERVGESKNYKATTSDANNKPLRTVTSENVDTHENKTELGAGKDINPLDMRRASAHSIEDLKIDCHKVLEDEQPERHDSVGLAGVENEAYEPNAEENSFGTVDNMISDDQDELETNGTFINVRF